MLLDSGWSCEKVSGALLLDDDTVRKWHGLFIEDGLEGLTRFEAGGGASFLNAAQEDAVKAFVATRLPRSTRQIGAFIGSEFGVVYESRSGLIALLHRLGLEYHKPEVIPRKLDQEKQRAFIEGYGKLLNSMADDEAVLFIDAPELVEGASNARRAARRLLGAQGREAGDRTNQRASAHQYSRRHRSGDRPNPDGPRPSTPPRRSGCWPRSRRSIRCWR